MTIEGWAEMFIILIGWAAFIGGIVITLIGFVCVAFGWLMAIESTPAQSTHSSDKGEDSSASATPPKQSNKEWAKDTIEVMTWGMLLLSVGSGILYVGWYLGRVAEVLEWVFP